MRKALKRGLAGVVVLAGVLALALAPFFLFTPRAPDPPAGIDAVTELEDYFNTLTANGTPPALAVVVLKDGATVYAKAFGKADSEEGSAARLDGVYHFWSVTKLFTATAIVQLAEEGRLSLDDPVTKHLPGFTTVGPAGAPATVTIRQLLLHTAGVRELSPFELVGWLHHVDEPPVNQSALVLDRMASYRTLAEEPGRTSTYSNSGYIILGAIIEAASGISYEEQVRRRILQPLGMTSSDFIYRGDLWPRAVSGSHPLFHVFTPLLLAIHPDWFSRWVRRVAGWRMWLEPMYTDYTGPTGLIGTAGDLARFGQAFLAGGEIDGKRILSTKATAQMLNEGYGGNTGPDGERMGLGWHWWDTVPIPFKGHGGEGPGFAAQLAVIPDRNQVIVIVANDTLIRRVALTQLIAGVFP